MAPDDLHEQPTSQPHTSRPPSPSDSGILYPNTMPDPRAAPSSAANPPGTVPSAHVPAAHVPAAQVPASAAPSGAVASDGWPQDLDQLAAIGTRIVGYQLDQRLGRCFDSVQYAAHHVHLGRPVVVSFYGGPLDDTVPTNRAPLEAWRLRLRAISALDDPAIAVTLDAGEYAGRPFHVAESPAGRTLAARLAQQGPWRVDQSLDLLDRLAAALRSAQRQGVMHGALTPQQIFVDDAQVVKIAGWTITQPFMPPSHLAQPIEVDLRCLAPEQCSERASLHGTSDVYALGCLLYWLLLGEPPWSGTAAELVRAHRDQPLPSLVARRPDVPTGVQLLCQRMVAKSPTQRPTWEEVIAELESCRLRKNQPASQESTGSGSSTLLATVRSGDSSRIVAGMGSSPSHPQFDPKQVLALDVGCAALRAAVLKQGMPTAIELAPGQLDYPNAVSIERDRVWTGWDALSNQRTAVARDIKALLGVSRSDAHVSMHTPPEVWQAFALRRVHDLVKAQAGYLRQTVLTIPGCFHELQRKAFQDAAYVASLNVLGTVNESTAIALWLAYQQGRFRADWHDPQHRNWLVIQLGRGSMEVAAMRWQGAELTVVARGGDCQLGLLAWDRQLAETLRQVLAPPHSSTVDAETMQAALLRSAETARVHLTQRDRVKLRGTRGGPEDVFRLTRATFEASTSSLLDRMVKIIHHVIEAAHIPSNQFDEVVLAGGGAHIPSVQQTVQSMFAHRPVHLVKESSAASLGAAVWAQVHPHASHAGTKLHLQEIHSVDIAIASGSTPSGAQRYTRILPANTPLPHTRSKTFGSSQASQASVRVPLVAVNEWSQPSIEPLGECQVWYHALGQLPGTQLKLVFQLLQDGRLQVLAESMATGTRQSLEIHRPTGLTEGRALQWRDWIDTTILTDEVAEKVMGQSKATGKGPDPI